MNSTTIGTSKQIPSRFQADSSSGVQELLRFGRLTWDFLTIVLVAFDALVLLILLAWPERFRENGPVDNFYKALEPWKMGRLRTCLIILSIKN